MKDDIHTLMGYRVIEDNSLTELRLPKEIISFIKSLSKVITADNFEKEMSEEEINRAADEERGY